MPLNIPATVGNNNDYTQEVRDPAEFTLAWDGWGAMTHKQIRQAITLKLANYNFAIASIRVSLAELQAVPGINLNGMTDLFVVDGYVEGIYFAYAYDETSEDTAPVKQGQPVVFDSVTGNSVTGINPAWGPDEYKVIGTSLVDFQYTSGVPRAKIPIRMTSPGVVSDLAVLLVETQEKLVRGGRCLVKKLTRNPSSIGVDWTTTGDAFYANDFTKDNGSLPGSWLAGPGYRGVVCKPKFSDDSNHDEWQIIILEHVAKFISGRLTEDMVINTPSQDTVLPYYWSQGATVDDWWDGKSPGTTQNIHDSQQMFRHALTGAHYIARRNDVGDGDPLSANLPAGCYILVECETKAGIIFFTLTASRTSGGPEEDLGITISKSMGTQQDVQPPTGILKVHFQNGQLTGAKNGDSGVATLDSITGKYNALFLTKSVQIQVDTQYIISSGTGKFQKKYQTIVVIDASDPSGWQDIVASRACGG